MIGAKIKRRELLGAQFWCVDYDKSDMANRDDDIDGHLVVALPCAHTVRVDPREVGLAEATEIWLVSVERLHNLAAGGFDPAKFCEVSGH